MRNEVYMPMLEMDDDWEPQTVRGICLVWAEKKFRERWGQDTHPTIVQMIIRGRLQNHWYYRSDQWIDQPYAILAKCVQPYRGIPSKAYHWLYGEGTYQVDRESTESIIFEITEGL